MKQEELLGEVEDLIRTAPTLQTAVQNSEVNFAWFGRVGAIIEQWDYTKAIRCNSFIQKLQAFSGLSVRPGDMAFAHITPAYTGLMTLLHQARHDLRTKTVGPLTVALTDGKVFDYFDEIRKIVEMARQDVLFIDPYLDAEFVSRYLPHIALEVKIRLLAGKKLSTLLPAVEAFILQNHAKVEVRVVSSGLHDRYVFIDKTICYQSGASFKDGAKKSPTTLTQITDAFNAVFQTYEQIWLNATVIR